jgi:hypothetical protein
MVGCCKLRGLTNFGSDGCFSALSVLFYEKRIGLLQMKMKIFHEMIIEKDIFGIKLILKRFTSYNSYVGNKEYRI